MRLAELLDEKKKNQTYLKHALGIVGNDMTRKWVNGGDIYVSRLVGICEALDVNPLEFFLDNDGRKLSDVASEKYYSKKFNELQIKESELNELTDNLELLQLRLEKREEDIKNQRVNFTCEPHQVVHMQDGRVKDINGEPVSSDELIMELKIKHAQEMAELKVSLKEEAFKMAEEARLAERNDCRSILQDRYNQIDEKNNEILRLKEDILNLKNELSTKPRPYTADTTNPMSIAAEPHVRPIKK